MPTEQYQTVCVFVLIQIRKNNLPLEKLIKNKNTCHKTTYITWRWNVIMKLLYTPF